MELYIYYWKNHFSRWPTKFIQHYITFIRVSFKHACIKSRYLNIMQSTWPLCELERTPTKARNTDALWIDSNFFTTKIIAQIDNPLKGLKSLAFCRKVAKSRPVKKYMLKMLPKAPQKPIIWFRKSVLFRIYEKQPFFGVRSLWMKACRQQKKEKICFALLTDYLRSFSNIPSKPQYTFWE